MIQPRLRTLACAAASVFALAVCGEDSPQLRLLGPEILRLSFDTRSLVACDVDGDGLTDLAVIDNQRGAVQLCLQLAPGREPRQRRRVLRNRWEPVLEDARFDRVSVPIGLRMFDLAVADFNGDGRADLAFTAEPGGLYVRFQHELGTFERQRRFDVPEPNQNGTALLAADLDGDGRTDLVMAARRRLHVFRQDAAGELNGTETLTLVDEFSAALQAHDVDGDGRLDLVYLAPQGAYSLRVRLQEENGRFGPERSFRLNSAVTVLARVRNGPGEPVSYAFVRDQPRRVELLQFRAGGAAADPLRPLVYASRPGARVAASYAVGDFDGDGRRDVAVADPEGAQILVYLCRPDGSLGSARSFPSFADVRSLAAADWNGDGRDDLLLVSVREQTAGVSLAQAEGRLGFPRALTVPGKPSCIEAADLDEDGIPEAVVAAEEGGRRTLHVVRPERAAGRPAFEPFVLVGTRTDPKAIRAIRGRGRRPDLAVFFNFEPVRLVLNDGATLRDAPAGASLRRGAREGIDPAGFVPVDFDGDGRDEFLAAGTGFARLLRMDDAGIIDIVEQFNARDGSSELQTAFFADIDGDGVRELLLVPRKGDAFEVLRRGSDGVYVFSSLLEVGESDVLELGRLGVSAAADDLLLLGRDRFWLLSRSVPALSAQVVESFETDLEEVSASDVEAGDLRGEGRDLLVVIDQRRNVVEFAVREGEVWRSFSHFVVFERDPRVQDPRTQLGAEPRQAVLADVTGDGRTDLVLLVHDRLLVYPQAGP